METGIGGVGMAADAVVQALNANAARIGRQDVERIRKAAYQLQDIIIGIITDQRTA